MKVCTLTLPNWHSPPWRAPLYPPKKLVSWRPISVQSMRIGTFWALWDPRPVFNRCLRVLQCSLRTMQQSVLDVKPSVESTDRDFTAASSVVFQSDPAGDRGRIRFPERALMIEPTYRSRSENRQHIFYLGRQYLFANQKKPTCISHIVYV